MKKRSILSSPVFITAMMIVFFAVPSGASEKITWRGQFSYTAGLPQLYAPAEYFAREVKPYEELIRLPYPYAK